MSKTKKNEKDENKNVSPSQNTSSEPQTSPQDELIDKSVHDRVNAAISEKVTDPAIVNQLAANSVEKVMEWVKPWQFIAKLILSSITAIFVIAAAWLGYFGIRTFSDIEKAVQSQVREAVEAEQAKSKKLVTDFERQLEDYRQKVDSKINKLKFDLSGIRLEVDILREKAKVREDLKEFERYMVSLGFPVPKDPPLVEINKKYDDYPHYDVSRNTINLGPNSSQDKDIIYRHYAHSLLKRYWALDYVESGLADYFACSFGDDAKFGEKYAGQLTLRSGSLGYLRNLNNSRNFADLPKTANREDAGEVWGGAFWEIRGELGKNKTDKLIVSAILSYTPDQGGSKEEEEFIKQLAVEAKRVFGKRGFEVIQSVFTKRGRVMSTSN